MAVSPLEAIAIEEHRLQDCNNMLALELSGEDQAYWEREKSKAERRITNFKMLVR